MLRCDERPLEHKLRLLTLVLRRNDGSSVEITQLRDPEWIADYGAHVGGTVLLDLAEMAAVGPAQVLAIDESPRIDPGPGRLITGTFHHTAAVVYNLKVESEREPFGVTGTHPFWSMDRQAWVSAADLKIGETLKTLEGTTVVESLERRPEPERVCNIEVEGDHVYRVGTSGVLVHNASAGVWTGPTHESCPAIKHCPQLDGTGSRFSNTPKFETEHSDEFFGIVLDTSGQELRRYHDLPKGFKVIVSKTGGGSKASPRILPPGWDPQANLPGSTIFNRGHLLANDLGGPGGVDDGGQENLVTQTQGFNLRVMKAGVEDAIKTLIGQGNQVYYQIIVIYDGGPIPDRLRIRACAKVGDELYDATKLTPHWEPGIRLCLKTGLP